MSPSFLYDDIGRGYAGQRRSDPRIAAHIRAALGDARTVVNVGAGTGSYEPEGLRVVAVEPSAVMVAQRSKGSPRAIRGRAESLPFRDDAFDAALAILTLHHWDDRAGGLSECSRVARSRIVLLTWDAVAGDFWLVQDYFPEFLAADRERFPAMEQYRALFGPRARVHVSTVPIPNDCVDGMLGAYWARPAAYLDERVRAGMSPFAAPDIGAGLARLESDLASGRWHERHGYLLERSELDLGYRLVVAELT